MIEVRYDLIECILFAIHYGLEEEELYSLLFTECNYNLTYMLDYISCMTITRRYYGEESENGL